MKYVVFGSSGFLGQFLVKELSNKGKRILCCDLDFPEGIYSDNNTVQYKVDIRDSVAVNSVDIASDDIVINLAANQYHLKVPRKNRKNYFFKTNYNGTENILSAMEKNNCKRLIYFSTDMVYGEPLYLPVAVDHKRCPFGPYGESKKASEDLCFRYRDKGFNITIFRPRMIMGPGRLGILKKLFGLINQNLPVPMIGNGKNCYQLVSVHDCVSAVIKAIEKGIPNREYNLGSDNPPKVRDLLKSLIHDAGSYSVVFPTWGKGLKFILFLLSKIGIEIMYKEQYMIADKNYIIDIEKTKSELGWEPKYNDLSMISSAYGFYLKQEK